MDYFSIYLVIFLVAEIQTYWKTAEGFDNYYICLKEKEFFEGCWQSEDIDNRMSCN